MSDRSTHTLDRNVKTVRMQNEYLHCPYISDVL